MIFAFNLNKNSYYFTIILFTLLLLLVKVSFLYENHFFQVCITGYRNHISLYIRPLDTLGLAHYNFIMESVAKCAETCM